MTRDISDAILTIISNFAIGLVVRKEGAGSEVLGSGVLVSIEGRRGILTCGHVAAAYEKLAEIGLIRFRAGTPQSPQRKMLQLGDTQTLILQSSDTFEESKEVLDLAFTQLPPHAATSVEAWGGVFLNIEKNRTKMESAAPAEGKHVDAILGLVAEFSEQPFIEGKEFISPMRGVLHTGHICGLWRIYFVEDQTSKIVATMLCGVTSWQIDDRKIACQGWVRIDQGLIPAVREKLQL